MLLTLHIDQLAPATYRATVTQGGVEVTEPVETYSSIADAIRQIASSVPEDLARFIEPRFGGVTCGTLRLGDAAQEAFAEDCARTIMALVAEMEQLGGC